MIPKVVVPRDIGCISSTHRGREASPIITKSTLLGSMFAAVQIRSSREHGSLSRMSEWTRVIEVSS